MKNLRLPRNVFRLSAWYVRLYNSLPNCIRPLYCESARVGDASCDLYCRFGWKGR